MSIISEVFRLSEDFFVNQVSQLVRPSPIFMKVIKLDVMIRNYKDAKQAAIPPRREWVALMGLGIQRLLYLLRERELSASWLHEL